MPQTTTQMDVSALNPTIWANLMQVPLRKTLVAEAVADTQFEPLLAYGDKVNQPYIDETSVETYTPGKPFEAKGTTATQDTLTVDQFKIVPNYVNNTLRTLGVTLLIKLRKLLETLSETISSEALYRERSTTIIGVSCC